MVSGYTDRGGYLGQRVGLVDDRRDSARFDQLGQKCRRSRQASAEGIHE
jgi:hypothetical protein